MGAVLPQFNIEFVEIPRFAASGFIVSATLVRKWLKSQEFDEIQKVVPVTTYDYLIKNRETLCQ